MYKLAADQGNAEGMVGLGERYYKGDAANICTVRPAMNEAFRLFHAAAEKDLAAGCLWVGRMYEKGEGGQGVSLDQARSFYLKAIQLGSEEAEERLAEMEEAAAAA